MMNPDDTRYTIGRTKLPATRLGYGGGGISNMYAAVSLEDAMASVVAAWDAGVRIFDTAPFYGYGLAERRMGDVLRGKPRDEFLLSTKVGRMMVPRCGAVPHDFFPESPMPFNPVFDYSYSATMRSFEDSQQRMGMDRFDILLIHDVDTAMEDVQDSEKEAYFAAAMEGCGKAVAELREQGVIGAIGLGANSWEICTEALKFIDFDVFLMAGRYSLLEHEGPYKNLFPLLERHSAKLLIGGAYNSGILAGSGPSSDKFNYAKASAEMIAKVESLRAKCDEMGVDIKAAALQFPAAHPSVASVMVGARSRAEVEENAAAFAAEIPASFWEEMGLAAYRS